MYNQNRLLIHGLFLPITTLKGGRIRPNELSSEDMRWK